jgi:phosphotransferase system IIB component/uncharacterized membrane protein YuzA (DUF378 family)
MVKMMQFDSLNSLETVFGASFFADWWYIFVIIIGMCAVAVYLSLSSKKEKRPDPGAEQVAACVKTFGGKENLKAVQLDGNRLRFELLSLKKCDYQGLKKLGATGIFVSGNHVKFIYKDNASALKSGIEAIIKESEAK